MNKHLLSVMAALLAVFTCNAQYYGNNVRSTFEGNRATFRIKSADAESVRVLGSFLPGTDTFGKGGYREMVRGEDDIWTYTTDPLEPNFYVYFFEIDGNIVLDPTNLKVVRNYVDFYNTFIISGPETKFLEYTDAPRGSMTSLWYYSPQYKAQRRMNVYLPAGYSSKQKYPVFYMLHGGGDDEDTWLSMGRIGQIMDNLIAEGKAKPMIIVMPNDWTDQLAAQNLMDKIPDVDEAVAVRNNGMGMNTNRVSFINDLIYTIIPYVDSHFSTLKGRKNRAIAGVSMGGSVQTNILREHPGFFDYIAFIGSGYGNPTQAEADLAILKEAGYKLFWIGAGDHDMAFRSAQVTTAAMDKANMPYVFYNSHGWHNWTSWRLDIQDLAPRLFK